MSLLEFLHDYSSIPKTLLDVLNVSALSAHATCSDTPVCSTDESDCSSDGGGCNTDTCSSDCNDSCSSDCGDTPSCENDESDCYWDSGGCITDDPTCTTDGVTPCSSDGVTPLKKRATVSITGITAYSATVRITINDATDISLEVLDTSTDNYVYDGDFSIVRPITTIELTGLTPNTNYSYCIWDDVGGNSTTYVFTTLSGRPENWTWWSDVGSGNPILLSANEWNAFCDRINEFREYKSLPQYGAFVQVKTGDAIAAATVNHAVWAVGSMNSAAMELAVKSGDAIAASFFNGLKDDLNGIK